MKFLIIYIAFWFSLIAQASSTCKPSISSLNKHARIIAQRVYDAGGNATDAFVAATLVEYVVAPGVTSLAGPLSVLVGDDHGKVEYLDANSNDPIDISGNWKPGEPIGKMVLAPTAPKGLHELWKKKGSLKWEQIINPAIKIAEDGFVLDAMYGGILNANSEKLKRTPYGQATYFNKGTPKAKGDLLKLPAMAATLKSYRDHGGDFFYKGQWSADFLQTVSSSGGKLTQVDLNNYQISFENPLAISFFDHEVLLPRGRSYAGLWVAAALKLSERLALSPSIHFSDSSVQFTKLLLMQRVLDSEPWLTDTTVLDDDSIVAKKLGRVEMARLWKRVESMDSEGLKPQPGSHSFHIATADCKGNFVTGTNTINTLPWGEGLFVGGIPLSTAGNLVGFATEPGERRLSAMAPWLIVDSKTKKWKVAGGNFGASLNLAGFQLITNLIRYGDDAKTAVSRPRFGTYPVDWSNFQSQKDANWIDERVPQDVRDHALSKGIRLIVDPRGDLGPSSIIGRKDNSYEPAWSLSLGSDARAGVGN